MRFLIRITATQHGRLEFNWKIPLFRGAMASQISDTQKKADTRGEVAASPTEKSLHDVEARLATLSDQMDICTAILSDLKELNEVLVTRSLPDVTLPLQK